MTSMFAVGTVCWIVACFFGTWFQYECLDVTTTKGIVLKSIAAFCVVFYAIALIIMFGETSSAANCFVFSLILVTIGDIVLAFLDRSGNGSSDYLLQTFSGESRNNRVTLCVAGILYICSYFYQTVAFIKGLARHANTTEYVVPFLVLLLLPFIFTLLGVFLMRVTVTVSDIKVFIIGAFYFLLGSASFAASSVFAFSLFQTDVLHATWVFVGGILFLLALPLVELRYSRPQMYDNKPIRVVSRLFTFIGRMMLAGCAFLL